MLFWNTFDIGSQEKGLLFRRNRLEAVLTPGRHLVKGRKRDLRLERFDISKLFLEGENVRFLLRNHADLLDPHLEGFEAQEHQVALYYFNNVLIDLWAPGEFHALWKGVFDVRVEFLDLSEVREVEPKLLGVMRRHSTVALAKRAMQTFKRITVPEDHVALLKINGKFDRVLATGDYGFWHLHNSIDSVMLDLRVQSKDINGQEILTRDRVSLRINLSVDFRIVDAHKVAQELPDYQEYIHRVMQLRLREAIGARTLDELLADKEGLNGVMAEVATERLRGFGIALLDVGLKDIILPGDMKTILNQVVEAQKEAEANLIRRREETQAMRSLHNTAKLMENNAVLLRLKELESLERITSRISSLNVYGGLEGVMTDLVRLGPK